MREVELFLFAFLISLDFADCGDNNLTVVTLASGCEVGDVDVSVFG